MSEFEFFRARTQSYPCFDFVGEDGQKEKVTAIIVPVRVVKSGNGWEISWACSRALSCQNRTCRYSKASKGEMIELENVEEG